jgi:mono/diheme cytochrome c family protein
MRAVRILTGAVAMAVVGCGTSGGPANSSSAEDEGKRIYSEECVTCHVAEPIDNYSAQQWREIIEDMAPKAKLSAAEEAELLRYILSVREGIKRGTVR